nr:hypothetical protein [Leucobacter muris]
MTASTAFHSSRGDVDAVELGAVVLGGDAGVVDEHVGCAEGRVSSVAELVPSRLVGDVVGDREQSLAGGLISERRGDALAEGREGGLADVARDDAITAAQQGFDDDGPEAACGAGDD